MLQQQTGTEMTHVLYSGVSQAVQDLLGGNVDMFITKPASVVSQIKASKMKALAADTDGIDGVEINAGAFVTPDTVARSELAGLSLQHHLDRHDSYGFFKTLNDLVITGPTHTNVNDFRAVLVL
jgi:glycerate-2-kinase